MVLIIIGLSENYVERVAERPIVSSNCQTWRRRALALAQLSQQNGITSTTINRCIPRKSIKTGPPRPVGGLCKTSNNWRAFSRCFINTGAPQCRTTLIPQRHWSEREQATRRRESLTARPLVRPLVRLVVRPLLRPLVRPPGSRRRDFNQL